MEDERRHWEHVTVVIFPVKNGMGRSLCSHLLRLKIVYSFCSRFLLLPCPLSPTPHSSLPDLLLLEPKLTSPACRPTLMSYHGVGQLFAGYQADKTHILRQYSGIVHNIEAWYPQEALWLSN